MSSTLLALLTVHDVFVLVKSNIHSIMVDVNPFGLHLYDTSFQPTEENA